LSEGLPQKGDVGCALLWHVLENGFTPFGAKSPPSSLGRDEIIDRLARSGAGVENEAGRRFGRKRFNISYVP
jgi:hypothetical protein